MTEKLMISIFCSQYTDGTSVMNIFIKWIQMKTSLNLRGEWEGSVKENLRKKMG